MTSTRLPGKVLMDIGGSPMLAQIIRRLRRANLVDEIVVATTINATDDPVVALATAEGVGWFRGSEEDVLSRYVLAAASVGADRVVRVTSDCPLLDPDVVDLVVGALEPEVDYASNVLERTFPVGLDCEAFHTPVLNRIDDEATSPEAREHVTWHIYGERPEAFALRSVVDDHDNSDLRWTVDTASDLAAARHLYERLSLSDYPRSYREVVQFVRSQPQAAGRGDRS
jgi:spore coat polysaccharide biosynthesis protein SpsF